MRQKNVDILKCFDQHILPFVKKKKDSGILHFSQQNECCYIVHGSLLTEFYHTNSLTEARASQYTIQEH